MFRPMTAWCTRSIYVECERVLIGEVRTNAERTRINPKDKAPFVEKIRRKMTSAYVAPCRPDRMLFEIHWVICIK